MKKLLIVAFLALTALPIHAAEEAEALSPFAGNLGNAIWTLAIFVIVVIVLGKFAWGPVLGLLQQREEFIHQPPWPTPSGIATSGSEAEGVRGEASGRARKRRRSSRSAS
jgi:F0F1-type ATP synthase, subunit b